MLCVISVLATFYTQKEHQLMKIIIQQQSTVVKNCSRLHWQVLLLVTTDNTQLYSPFEKAAQLYAKK